MERARWKDNCSKWSEAANRKFGPVEGTRCYNGWWRNKEACDQEPTKIGREALDRLIPQWATDRIELVTGRGPGTDHPNKPVAFTNVECDRKSFEGWLRGLVPDQGSADASFQIANYPPGATLVQAAVEESSGPLAREKKKPGAKPNYDWAAIENAARHIAASPKVPGIKPATERLIAAIQEWHQKQHPNCQFPARTTIQRKIDQWGLS